MTDDNKGFWEGLRLEGLEMKQAFLEKRSVRFFDNNNKKGNLIAWVFLFVCFVLCFFGGVGCVFLFVYFLIWRNSEDLQCGLMTGFERWILQMSFIYKWPLLTIEHLTNKKYLLLTTWMHLLYYTEKLQSCGLTVIFL